MCRSNVIESIVIKYQDASRQRDNDQRVDRIINEKTKFVPNVGRYEVGLLWKHKYATISDNYEEAENRLLSTERRLRRLNMVVISLDFLYATRIKIHRNLTG